jgi:hypothetical protein
VTPVSRANGAIPAWAYTTGMVVGTLVGGAACYLLTRVF